MIIKICGLTRIEDVDACAQAGADLVGFNMWPQSPRHIELGTARQLATAAQEAGLETVALLVAPDAETLRRVDADPLFDWVQPYRLAHGAKPVVSRWLEPRSVSGTLPAFDSDAHRVLVETAVPELGGSGKRFDWTLLAGQEAVGQVMVAGGIRPDNVADLLKIVQPWGIDVASGVEARPGLKDPVKIRTLIQTVRDIVSDSSTTS
ncbi:MAG: phosphoribosylanthranilate isomerase [Candidatus Dadabacteria bacterium]|nr:MAG: phosphoribosylanthranilate isomerase [Candidatus Dadabacteria bacterium]